MLTLPLINLSYCFQQILIWWWDLWYILFSLLLR